MGTAVKIGFDLKKLTLKELQYLQKAVAAAIDAHTQGSAPHPATQGYDANGSPIPHPNDE